MDGRHPTAQRLLERSVRSRCHLRPYPGYSRARSSRHSSTLTPDTVELEVVGTVQGGGGAPVDEFLARVEAVVGRVVVEEVVGTVLIVVRG